MHICSNTSESKSKAMFFPATLKQAKLEALESIVPEDLALPDGKKVHFIRSFKFLGSIITPLLNEDAEIKARIKKAKAVMGIARTFFDNKDVDKRIKTQIYVAGPPNALLWGCEAWNLTKRNLSRLRSFHHGAICRILAIKWNQVREKHIKNEEVRAMLCNIPNIDAYITKRTAAYLGKVSRSDNESLPKKFLAALIQGSQKNGAPQLSCNNNFAEAINKILAPHKTLSNKSALLKEWIPLARDVNNWQLYIDNYFEICHKTDPRDKLKIDGDENRKKLTAENKSNNRTPLSLLSLSFLFVSYITAPPHNTQDIVGGPYGTSPLTYAHLAEP
jgi:hypothetical protein